MRRGMLACNSWCRLAGAVQLPHGWQAYCDANGPFGSMNAEIWQFLKKKAEKRRFSHFLKLKSFFIKEKNS